MEFLLHNIKKLTMDNLYSMDKSQKHAEQKMIQKNLYCMTIYIWNFREENPNLKWQKVD